MSWLDSTTAKFLAWVECHPNTMFWFAVVATANFVISIIRCISGGAI